MIVKTDFSVATDRVRAAMRQREERHRDQELTRSIDSTLEDSFPASDPPSWTASVATPGAARSKTRWRA